MQLIEEVNEDIEIVNSDYDEALSQDPKNILIFNDTHPGCFDHTAQKNTKIILTESLHSQFKKMPENIIVLTIDDINENKIKTNEMLKFIIEG